MHDGAGPLRHDALRDHAWLFLRSTPEHAAFVLAQDGTIRWANACAAETFDDPGLAGQHISHCFVEEDIAHGVPVFELDVARTTGAMENDRWMRRADKSRFWAEGATVALFDDDEVFVGYLKILRNRTTHKMGTEALRNQVADRATHAEKCERAMFTLAHELRNPLATMMQSAELVDRLPPGDPRIEATVAALRRSLDFATRLVDDLVDTTRASTGRLSLKCADVDLGALLRDAIGVAQARASGKACRIDLLLPPSPLHIQADAQRLHQVFVNLVSNAVRYTPEDGRAWVSAVLREDEVVVKVEDTGMGITSETLAHLFEMFTQAKETKTLGGLGIGLSLVQQIVQLHGGTVQAQSDGPGKGSLFLVTLPVVQGGHPALAIEG